MVRQRGKGERRAQLHFYSRARRLCASGREQKFVGYVQDVETVSSQAVDSINIDSRTFRITVTRRGVTDEEEAVTMELSRNLHRCAEILVDRAADIANVSRDWGRRVTLHEAYQKAMRQCQDKGRDEKDAMPHEAGLQLLLETIGNMPADAVSDVVKVLKSDDLHRVHTTGILVFAENLLKFCREEQLHRSRPVVQSITTLVGGLKAVPILLSSTDTNAPSFSSDVSCVASALSSAVDVPVPSGCDAVKILVQGKGKYSFSTKASPSNTQTANDYLESVVSHVQQVWQAAASAASPSAVRDKACYEKPENTTKAMQPTLNIGVVGDVANGKSTLVRAMSGKRTQAHSSEQQQHGITIRLGFANVAVLRCQNQFCGCCTFLPESKDTVDACLSACAHCQGVLEVVNRVSFIDCPGHAELMATMLAGVSAFDAVILAAAATTPCPTPQAKQHLEAIEISGVLNGREDNISIAQTKAELLVDSSASEALFVTPLERLENHARQGRRALRKTVAANAPFFPTCSPLSLGLESLAEWIANLETKAATATEDGAPSMKLTVLRSFDINRPGNSTDDLIGGVLGGAITGDGEISIGDQLEVRPGLFIQGEKPKKKRNDENKKKEMEPFRVQPLSCYCTTLMTGKTPLASATKGGLIAVGTTLCASFCADNGLVGAVAGRPGTLPPVWGPNLYLNELEFISLAPEAPTSSTKGKQICPAEFLKKGTAIRCHIGSATVKGQVWRVSSRSKKLQVLLEAPVCCSTGSAAAIEAKVTGKSYLLVAHARVFGGDCCVEGVEENKDPSTQEKDTKNTDEGVGSDTDCDAGNEEESEALKKDDVLRRNKFLAELQTHNENTSDIMSGYGKLSVPFPKLARDGGAHVLIENFNGIASALRRDPQHIVNFLHTEGGLSCTLATGNCLRVGWRGGGRNFPTRFSVILKRYIIAYVMCNQCRCAFTELSHSKLEVLCRRCNARRFVPKV